jgi:hypothetical protein
MTINNGTGFARTFAGAIGGKGLLLALALAGAGLQGCDSESAPAAPAPAAENRPPVDLTREDRTGADLNADYAPQANPATAEAPASPSALAKTAPGCVEFETFTSGMWTYAEVINTCKTDQRLRFIWAWAVDGKCVTVPAGNPPGIHYENRGRQAYVTEIRSC